MKWLILFLVAAVNVAGAFYTLVPGLLTYAEVSPEGITCSACNTPEVQKALTAAATYGRATILRGLEKSSSWLPVLVFFNIAVVGWLLFWPRRSNNSLVPTPGTTRHVS